MAEKASLPIWRLRRGMDRRFRSGHPWVYSNELQDSPKGITPGAWVELHDSAGKFLARGFGNPHSLIAFRVVSRDPEVVDPRSQWPLLLKQARNLRTQLGMAEYSHRLFYGEADGIPGLIIDRYVLHKGQDEGQVFVLQAHTAGADRILPEIQALLQAEPKSSIVIRNDLSVRKLEGLEEQSPQVVQSIPGLDLRSASIQVRSVVDGEPLKFQVNLLEGQKTGFFLDQFANIQLAALRLKGLAQGRPIKILDLCCYVGQWGAQLSPVFRNVDVLAVDASQSALDLAKRNIEFQGGRCEVLKADVLKDLGQLKDQSFDLVISDPPALIKNRKDIPQGTHAYLQLNTQVFRLVKKGGAVVCCSCSGLLEEESFTQTLGKAARRNQASVRWIGRGGPAPDHPVLSEFPEGRYLKAWVGVVT